MRAWTALALSAAVAAPLHAAGVDAPHDRSQPLMAKGCEGCHKMHAAGADLSRESSNSALCHSCHDKATPDFGFPWGSADQANPGTSGRSHSWSANATSAAHGATAPNPSSSDPLEAAMGQHLNGGNLQCSTCHDVHQADVHSGTLHTSVALATNVAHTVGTTTVLQLTSVPEGAKAAGYVIKVSGTNQYKISHDNGATYLGWDGGSWDLDTVVGHGSGKGFTPGTPVALDDALTMVTFSGTITVGDVFAGFYVSYPFLIGDSADGMCVTCHKERDMRWQDAEGGPENGYVGGVKDVTLGTTVFSHPVGQGMNANGRGRDRSASRILDANGSEQSSSDGKKRNDIKLHGSNVTCLSCHAVHDARSNALTPDP